MSWRVACDSNVTPSDFEDSDAVCTLSTATITAGSTSSVITIMTNDDSMAEGMEEFRVMLTDVSPNIEGRITISSTRGAV